MECQSLDLRPVEPGRSRFQELAKLLRTLEERAQARGSRAQAGLVPTGWPSVDGILKEDAPSTGGLVRGAIHEWIGLARGPEEEPPRPRPEGWTPPLLLLTHLAWKALEEAERSDPIAPRWVLWIGRRVRPYPRALLRAPAGDRRLLQRSLFVDPPDGRERLWTIDLALRCPSAAAVVADAAFLNRIHTRRLQLAAEAGEALGLLARPPWEEREPSAAATRWSVRPSPGEVARAPRWDLEWLRCRGTQPHRGGAVFVGGNGRRPGWTLEWNDAQGALVELPDLVDRPRAATRESEAAAR